MNQILDSILIALQAIWANKLRSFMTVLGNIVAVTSIVTVVTLIQGMNAMVSDAIVSDVGADSFTDPAPPPIRSEDDEERTRNNPLHHARRSRRHPRVQPAHRVGRWRRPARNATVSYRTEEIDNVQHSGRDQRVLRLLDLQRRARPHDERGRGRAQPAGRAARLRTRPTACSARSIRSTRRSRSPGIRFRVVGVSEKKGSFFGNSQDNFAVIPLGAYQKLFGARQSLQLMVKPTSTDALPAAMDDATVALRVARRLKPPSAEQLRHLHLRHASSTSTAR